MSVTVLTRTPLVVCVCFASLMISRSAVDAAEMLIADRMTHSVYRYSEAGEYLGTLIDNDGELNQPTGIAVSPDKTKLFVSNFQTSTIIQYDYDYAAGTATNPTLFANTGLAQPNTMRWSPDGQTLYVSNFGGTGVARFNLDGTSAGPAVHGVIAGGSIFMFSGLTFADDGSLLVGGFQDYPAGSSGAIARSDTGMNYLTDFIAPSPLLTGASGMLVNGNALYVAVMFGDTVSRYDLTTGVLDPSFNVSGFSNPQDLILAPGGNSFFVGVLGFGGGDGFIAEYDFEGNLVREFAAAAGPGELGFTEATAMVMVPEPSTAVLTLLAAAFVGLLWRKRR